MQPWLISETLMDACRNKGSEEREVIPEVGPLTLLILCNLSFSKSFELTLLLLLVLQMKKLCNEITASELRLYFVWSS